MFFLSRSQQAWNLSKHRCKKELQTRNKDIVVPQILLLFPIIVIWGTSHDTFYLHEHFSVMNCSPNTPSLPMWARVKKRVATHCQRLGMLSSWVALKHRLESSATPAMKSFFGSSKSLNIYHTMPSLGLKHMVPETIDN